jgi:multiple sugar transport system permease protein
MATPHQTKAAPAPGVAERRARRRGVLAGLAWVSPWLIGSCLFVFAPMVMSLYYSFTDYPLLEPPLWTGLDNYKAMGNDPTFWRVVRNTAVFAGLSIPLYTIVALLLAAMLAGKGRMAPIYRACVFIPTLVPLIASAMVWMWLFNGEYGLINQLIGPVVRLFHGTPPAWIVDKDWVMTSMVIMSLWGVGQGVVIYIAAMQDVPRQLYEAARIDGMGVGRQFLHVTLPMISPSILFNVIALSIAAVQVFAVPYVMFRRPDGQNPVGHFYTMYLYENAFIYGKMGYASAMAWLQLVVVLVLTGVMLLASKKLVHYARV